MEELLSHKLDDMAKDIGEIKEDVRTMKDAAPVHRISSLEEWRRGVNKWLGAMSVAVVGSLLAALLR